MNEIQQLADLFSRLPNPYRRNLISAYKREVKFLDGKLASTCFMYFSGKGKFKACPIVHASGDYEVNPLWQSKKEIFAHLHQSWCAAIDALRKAGGRTNTGKQSPYLYDTLIRGLSSVDIHSAIRLAYTRRQES